MLTVREAVLADAEAIGRVQVETWRAAYTGLMPEAAIGAFGLEARQSMWRDLLGTEPRPGSATFVAEAGGAVLGFANVGTARDEPEGVGELYAIYVDAASWGTGAGRALIEAAEASLRSSGFREAMLWVLEGNERAERFYRAAGWTRDGGRKVDVFSGVPVTEVRYRKPL